MHNETAPSSGGDWRRVKEVCDSHPVVGVSLDEGGDEASWMGRRDLASSRSSFILLPNMTLEPVQDIRSRGRGV